MVVNNVKQIVMAAAKVGAHSSILAFSLFCFDFSDTSTLSQVRNLLGVVIEIYERSQIFT